MDAILWPSWTLDPMYQGHFWWVWAKEKNQSEVMHFQPLLCGPYYNINYHIHNVMVWTLFLDHVFWVSQAQLRNKICPLVLFTWEEGTTCRSSLQKTYNQMPFVLSERWAQPAVSTLLLCSGRCPSASSQLSLLSTPFLAKQMAIQTLG